MPFREINSPLAPMTSDLLIVRDPYCHTRTVILAKVGDVNKEILYDDNKENFNFSVSAAKRP